MALLNGVFWFAAGSGAVWFVVHRGSTSLRWLSWQRYVLGVAPVVVAVATAVMVATGPAAVSVSQLTQATPGATLTSPQVVRPVSASEAYGAGLLVLLGAPIVLTALPLTFGLRPWPRRAFGLSALALSTMVVGGFSLGLLFLPAAVSAWLAVAAGPNDSGAGKLS